MMPEFFEILIHFDVFEFCVFVLRLKKLTTTTLWMTERPQQVHS